jgi:hypothetical protein
LNLPLIGSIGMFLAISFGYEDEAVIKDYLKSILRDIKENKDYSFIYVTNPVCEIHRVTLRQASFEKQSPKKITYLCDYFFFLATYIYMRGQIYDSLLLTRKKI